MMIHAGSLSVAGMRISLELDAPELVDGLNQRYGDFYGRDVPQMTAHICWQDSSGCESNAFPTVHFSDTGWEFEAPFYKGKIDLQRKEASLEFVSTQPFEGIDYFLRLIVAMLAYEHKGFLFHAAGVVRLSRAYIFLGHSGAGKTTVSRHSGEQNVLNDDLIVLFPRGDGWWVYATPFWNPSQVRPKPSSAPLYAMYHLVQDRSVFLEDISPSLGLAEFLACVPIISMDPYRNQVLMRRVLGLLETYPVRNLHFLPDDSFWNAIV
jgi:hypothetical protein